MDKNQHNYYHHHQWSWSDHHQGQIDVIVLCVCEFNLIEVINKIKNKRINKVNYSNRLGLSLIFSLNFFSYDCSLIILETQNIIKESNRLFVFNFIKHEKHLKNFFLFKF